MTARQLEQARLDYGGIIGAIVAVLDPHAPRGIAWRATVGPDGPGAAVGHGRTRDAAIDELLVSLDRA
jgi:hypothetical protein